MHNFENAMTGTQRVIELCTISFTKHSSGPYEEAFFNCIVGGLATWCVVELDIGASQQQRHSPTPSIRGAPTHLVMGSWSDQSLCHSLGRALMLQSKKACMLIMAHILGHYHSKTFEGVHC